MTKRDRKMRVSLRIDEDIMQELRYIATRCGVQVAPLIRYIMRDFIKRVESENIEDEK